MVLKFTPEGERPEKIDHDLLASSNSNLSLHGINAVLLVEKYGEITFAATQAKLSQPGMSRLIQRTERAVGIEIFTRRTQPMTVTPKGERVVASFKAFAAAHTDLLTNTLSLRQYADRLPKIVKNKRPATSGS